MCSKTFKEVGSELSHFTLNVKFKCDNICKQRYHCDDVLWRNAFFMFCLFRQNTLFHRNDSSLFDKLYLNVVFFMAGMPDL